jgi:hypothetical protein
VLRSKNAGPFELTLDVLFADRQSYDLVKKSGVLTRELLSRLYGVAPDEVYHIVFFDPALAIEIILKRPIDSGGIGDTDAYGAQPRAPDGRVDSDGRALKNPLIPAGLDMASTPNVWFPLLPLLGRRDAGEALPRSGIRGRWSNVTYVTDVTNVRDDASSRRPVRLCVVGTGQ